MSQQKLRGVTSVAAKSLVVGPDQEGLTHGGGGLELAKVIGAAGQSKLANAGTDRPGTDQGDTATGRGHGADLLGEVPDPVGVEGAVRSGQDAGADLHHPGVGTENHVITDQVASHRRVGLSRGRRCSRARSRAGLEP